MTAGGWMRSSKTSRARKNLLGFKSKICCSPIKHDMNRLFSYKNVDSLMTKRASLSGAQMWNFVLQSEGEKRRGTILAAQDCIFKVGPSLKSVFIENKTPLGTAATKIVGLDWLIKRNPLDRDFSSDRWRRKRQKKVGETRICEMGKVFLLHRNCHRNRQSWVIIDHLEGKPS